MLEDNGKTEGKSEEEEAEDEVNESEGSKKGANEIQMRKWKVHFDKSKLYIKYMENEPIFMKNKSATNLRTLILPAGDFKCRAGIDFCRWQPQKIYIL